MVLEGISEFRLLKKWLGVDYVSLKRLYSAREDGDSMENFKQKCQDAENTLTFIKTD